MDLEGLECTCTCPSCSVGICLCAISSRARLENAWGDAGPIVIDKGITVLPPKAESPASIADLRVGDIIIAVEGHNLDKYGMIQDAIRSHKSGENIELLVQRQSGEQDVVLLRIP